MTFHRLQEAWLAKLNSMEFSYCCRQNALHVPHTWENGSGRQNGCTLSIRSTVSTLFLFFFMFYHHLMAEPQNTALRHHGSYRATSAMNWLGNHQLHIIPELLLVLLLLAYIADTSNITFQKNCQHLILYFI